MKGKTRTRMKEMVKKFKLLKQVRETKKIQRKIIKYL